MPSIVEQVFRTPNVQVTCSEPVVLLGGQERSRIERAGVESAAVIRPLAGWDARYNDRRGGQGTWPRRELTGADLYADMARLRDAYQADPDLADVDRWWQQ